MEEQKKEVIALVRVNPSEFGLEATQAAQVEAVFLPMIEKMTELETEFNEVLSLPIEPTTCKKAKELRLKFVKLRTGTAEIHKGAKAFYLAGSRFVDAWKNAQVFASQGKETALERIEKHFEILEAERKEKLRVERIAALSAVCETPDMYPVQDMGEPAFKQLLDGLTLAKQQREEAERKAEEERVAKEKAEAEELERIRLENISLKEQAAKDEAERLRLAKERAEEIAKEKAAREAAERKAAEERRAIEEKARKEREAAENKARLEREAHEKEIAAQKAKAEAEKKAADAKAKAEREAAENKAEEDLKRARLEKERLEKLLADTICCPNCKHEFLISSVKG